VVAQAPKDTSLFVEGVGGIMVPLDERRTTLDWIIDVQLPLVLVTGSYLGTLSHTLTAMDILRRYDLAVAVVAVCESADSHVPLDETAQTISKFISPIKVVAFPRQPDAKSDNSAFGELAKALL